MALFKYITIIFLNLISTSLYSESYTGTIGENTSIVLELKEVSNDSYEGRYFYEKHKRDILLTGPLHRLEERPANEHFYDKPKNYWQGTFVNNEFIGDWVDIENDKRLPLRLHKIKGLVPSSDQDEKDKTRSAYDMDRVLKYSKPIKHADVSYQWVTDPVSSFSYPLIVHHPLKHEKKRLNTVLMARFWDYVLANDPCDDVIGVTVNYLSSKVLDITESGFVFCGASPEKIYEPKTFIFSTGKLIQWRDYFSGISATDIGEEITDKALLERMREAIKASHDLQKSVKT